MILLIVEKRDFADKLKKLNIKVISNKTKHIEAEKKLTDKKVKLHKYWKKGYDFSLGRMYFTGNDGYQFFLLFAPMLKSLMLDSNKKVTNWILTGISSEKIKPFGTGLEPTLSNLAKGRVMLNLTALF